MVFLAVLLILLAAGPIKLIRARQRQKKMNFANADIFENEDIFNEGFEW